MPQPMTTFNVLDYGADLTGGADSAPAFGMAVAAALAAPGGNGGVVIAPPGTYRLSSGISVPSGVTLTGADFQPANPGRGTVLLFDEAVQTGVTLGGVGAAGGNGAASLRELVIDRASGAIPAGSIGLLVQNLYGAICEDVYSRRHAIPIYCIGDTSGDGIHYHFDRVFTAVTPDTHMVVDGVVEVYVSNSRFGENGTGDLASLSYLAFINSVGGTGSVAPNTIFFEQCHFNQGQNTAGYLARFVYSSVPELGGEVKFAECHVEAVGAAYLFSDPTWSTLTRFSVSGCTFNADVPVLALDPATAINDWEFVGNEISGTSFTLAPAAQINALTIVGNRFNGCGPTITAPANSTINSIGNMYGGSFTLNGSGFSAISIDNFLAGSFVNNSANAAVSVLTSSSLQVGNGPPRADVRFAGTTDASGNALFAHGIALGSRRILSAQAYVETSTDVGGPMSLAYFDNTNVRFTSPTGYARYRAYLSYSADVPAW